MKESVAKKFTGKTVNVIVKGWLYVDLKVILVLDGNVHFAPGKNRKPDEVRAPDHCRLDEISSIKSIRKRPLKW